MLSTYSALSVTTVRKASLSSLDASSIPLSRSCFFPFWFPHPSMAIRYCIITSLLPTALWPTMWKVLVIVNKAASWRWQLHSSWPIAGPGLGNWEGGAGAGKREKKLIIVHFLFSLCTSNSTVTRGKSPTVSGGIPFSWCFKDTRRTKLPTLQPQLHSQDWDQIGEGHNKRRHLDSARQC